MGPGLLVTAAFIGPGTVTTATLAGASFGFALLWAVVFSAAATLILQEMSARIGLVARMGPAEALRVSIENPMLRGFALVLVILAIGFGNAAFQTGNITGAAIGLEAAAGGSSRLWSILIGASAGVMLFFGTYRHIERLLIVLVVLMSAAFITTAWIARPPIHSLLDGLIPRIPDGSMLTVIALIGTTVVPYNLFLHAGAVQVKWPAHVPLRESLSQARWDAGLSIGIGGLVTFSIVLTAASFFAQGTTIESASRMADQLVPHLGSGARYLFLAGLTAAGLTSAVTAPLAAAYATCGALGRPADLTSTSFRAIWFAVLVIGTILASLGQNPIQAIRFAQAFNGLLLPIVAVFLLYVMNRRRLLGEHTNGPLANVLGAIVVLVTAAFGLRQIAMALGLI